jgi:hypothetical protein
VLAPWHARVTLLSVLMACACRRDRGDEHLGTLLLIHASPDCVGGDLYSGMCRIAACMSVCPSNVSQLTRVTEQLELSVRRY